MVILPAIPVIAHGAIGQGPDSRVFDKARAVGAIMVGVPDWQLSLRAPISTNDL